VTLQRDNEADVVVQLAPLNAYEELLGDSLTGDAA
jgi:hypothetical protein